MDAVRGMRDGVGSSWLRWRPEPLSEREVDALWVDALRNGPRLPLQLYTHMPYCPSSCTFCMYFHRVPQAPGVYEAAIDHLVALVRRFAERAGRHRICAAYVGGGTPTAAPVELLERYLETLHRSFDMGGRLTLEAHPNTTTPEALGRLATAGVSRISMGLQSLDPDVLQRIHRRNPPLDAVGDLVAAAHERTVEVNLDLVVGLPGQNAESLREDVRRVIALGPDTITLYLYEPTPKLAGGGLTFEKALGPRQYVEWARAGFLARPPSKGAASVVLVRPSAPLARDAAGWLGDLAAGRPTIVRYEAFSRGPTHLLGFGPGAIGHVWGRAWTREVTRLEDVPCEARYTASRLDAADEARSAMRRAMRESRPIRLAKLARLAGTTESALVGSLPERDAPLRIRGGWLVPRLGASSNARRAVCERWMPSGPASGGPLWDDESLEGAERELVALRAAPRDRAVVRGFRELLGIPGKGRRWRDAWVLGHDDTGVTFSVARKDAAPLRLIVEESSRGTPALFRSRRYAIGYSADGGRELTHTERVFLEDLGAALLREDPPAHPPDKLRPLTSPASVR